MGDMDPSGAMIHRQELDDQERLDLEEEARERELSGQGFGGAQTAGQSAATQPGELSSVHVFHLFSFLPSKIACKTSRTRGRRSARKVKGATAFTGNIYRRSTVLCVGDAAPPMTLIRSFGCDRHVVLEPPLSLPNFVTPTHTPPNFTHYGRPKHLSIWRQVPLIPNVSQWPSLIPSLDARSHLSTLSFP
jgi:hypothetical protein